MDAIKGIMVMIITGILMVMAILIALSPIMYLEGSANSQWLREKKGIEMVWYKAAFLPDTVFIDANIKSE